MISLQERELVVQLVRTVLPSLNAADPAHRADLLDGISIVTREAAPDISVEAARTASAIRDAAAAQLTFASILK